MCKNTLPLKCSFCNKLSTEVSKLIAGPTSFICDECVSLCVEIIVEDGLSICAKQRKQMLDDLQSALRELPEDTSLFQEAMNDDYVY